jgi:hypothetical protein
MTKAGPRKTLEQQLAELNPLRADPSGDAARATLTKALESARAPLTAAAANIVGEAELTGFEPALLAAFERWMEQPAKSDPNCIAKTSAIRALYRLNVKAHDAYLRGIRYFQTEAAQDSAFELRGLCALALVRSGYFDALVEVAELLADPEPMARLAAAQAVAYSERQDIGVPLLRFKARVGDADPRVMSACLAGLLSLAPASSLPFVASVIESGPIENREAALLALGESRAPGALPILRRAADDPLGSDQRASAFVAIALLRSDAAWDYLLGVLRDEGRDQAAEALSALATYRSDENLARRTLEVVRERADPNLLTRAERLFQREL